MNVMKEVLLTVLRDKNTGRADFREATKKLGYVLAFQVAEHLKTKKVLFHTPLTRTQGLVFAQKIMFVPILRSGMALLPPFTQFFPEASVGVVGIRRDEKTAKPKLYYKNWPRVECDAQVIILDPMLATGGTLVATLSLLRDKGFKEENILFVGIVASPEGIGAVRDLFPKVKLILAARDKKLNKAYFIVPGLGDFGDRYFGTE